MSIMTLSDTAWQRLFGNALVINTSRIEGVAPLGVSFDLVDTVFNDDDTLMLAEFMWDFGDTGTANGTGTDDEYNVGKGYAVSHVYREVGTYTAIVSAYWGAEQALAATASVTIEVSEFSGTTYYISADGSDSNDGLTEDTPFLTPVYALTNFMAPSTKFLMRQGDTFSKSEALTIGAYDGVTIEGPVYIGSYEDESNPSGVAPIIYDDRVDAGFINGLGFLNCDDFRLVNVKVQCAGGAEADRVADAVYPDCIAMSVNAPCSNFTMLDCHLQGGGPHGLHAEGNYNIFQDSLITNAGSYGVFQTQGFNTAYIGFNIREFANDLPEYTMRLSTSIQKNYIAYCDFRADWVGNDFQIRGDDSSYNYVWNNQFDRFVGINQTNNEEDETLHHNTFDSNILVGRDYESISGDNNGRGFFFSSNNSMCRNNIVYGMLRGFSCNTHEINGGCKNMWYHNNTIICTDENSYFLGMYNDTQNVEMRNNIFYNLSTTSSYADRFINIAMSSYSEDDMDLSQIDSDYNCFIGEGWGTKESQTLVGVAYETYDPTLAEWQDTWGNDVHSYYADAELNTTITLDGDDLDDINDALANGFATISETSPALNTGDSTTVYTMFDFFGNVRTDKSMGAIGV
jgi:hypothetical protein